ncbi:MAG TPA: (Fe-S)-binding protein [Bdellovibrionota bacterium]|nr:(Fe-S)-binding protein [Bdellovibrionota bacterium]
MNPELKSQPIDSGISFSTSPHAIGNRANRFLEVFAAILKHTQYGFVLDHFAALGTKCGRCSSDCHVYRASGDLHDSPCRRSDLLLQVYRRHFTTSGFLQARVLGIRPMLDADVDEISRTFYRCNSCARCTLRCPMGVDHQFINHLGRYILSEMGLVPAAFKEPVRAPSLPQSAGRPTWISELELDLERRFGRRFSVPFERNGAEYVFFPGHEIGYDGLGDQSEKQIFLAEVSVLENTGASYSLTPRSLEPAGAGGFHHDLAIEELAKELVAEARRLGARKILIGECADLALSAKRFVGAVGGSAIKVESILEYSANAIASGKLKPIPRVVSKRVIYHDPCSIARTGWIVEPPRGILRTFCSDLVEPRVHGQNGFCCGGCGGLVLDSGNRVFRTQVAGRETANELRSSGAKVVVASCARCRKQLRELVEDHRLEMEVVGLHELLFKAMREIG